MLTNASGTRDSFMTVEHVKQFFASLAVEPSRREKLQQLNATYRGQALDEARRLELIQEHVLPIAESMGFSFTVDDLRDYEVTTFEAVRRSGQLSNDELDVIRGGGGNGGSCEVLGMAPNVSPYWLNGCPLGI
ncbi:hypothetical protein Thi970DRAFT_01683 [Thiorhodovibrio frisius]|uniref:Nif11 domain-containing protein n=2 Tax=Thiorhodovibrio frisius TaxID=631362 RepID=H8Z1M7_9GAMM|nr:hypothetical protein Thi970DRAFT_01683 [Thiorhodovibrio frisius]WPL24058.1 hypothetical protein Thiofri_04270 [Thiorhodovibrio frisius]